MARAKYSRIKEFNNLKNRTLRNIDAQQVKGTFPNCRGQFDTCPSEDELNAALKEKMAPAVCGSCPVFEKSNVKGIKVMAAKPRMSDEDLEFYRKMVGK